LQPFLLGIVEFDEGRYTAWLLDLPFDGLPGIRDDIRRFKQSNFHPM